MNVVVWARVSSREQKEGYSIDAQLRACRGKAKREKWQIVREFAVAESAKRGAARAEFNRMFTWVKKNARKEGVEAILSHKLDRVCRNLRDAVRLQELEDACGVRLLFVENQFGPGAAGQFSFNVMAAVAQYYSENLQAEVRKGMDEKVRQGWLPAHAPYGYINVPGNRQEPIQPDPEKAPTVVRIFLLYAQGTLNLVSLGDALAEERRIYRPTQPRFTRTTLSYIRINRFYVGEIKWRGETYPGKHQPLVNQELFDTCQEILNGRTRRTSNPQHELSGGLFRCAICGAAITGERIRRPLADGSVRDHIYYRCAKNHRGPDHPVVRWRARDLEEAVAAELEKLRMPSKEVAEWFRKRLAEAVADRTACRRRRRLDLLRQQAEVKRSRDRLLDARIAGDVDAPTFRAKKTELEGRLREIDRSLHSADTNSDGTAAPWGDISGATGDISEGTGDMALVLFDWSQQAADLWRGSKNGEKRDILDALSSNRLLSDVSLVLEKRRPFDLLAERPSCQSGRGDWI